MTTSTAKTARAAEDHKSLEQLNYWEFNGKPPSDPRKEASKDIEAVMRKHATALKRAFQKV